MTIRKLQFKNEDGKILAEFEIHKAAEIRQKNPEPRMYVEPCVGSNGVRLVWSNGLVEDMTQIKTIEIVREN